MYGNLVPIKLGLGVIASKLLWPIVLITPFLLRELDAQFTFPDPTCFVVNNSEQCPFINGLKVLPLAGLYTNEDELEAFLAGQGPKDSDYMETFAAENGCSPNASNTHRYHKSVACYTILAASRSCQNSFEPKLCREQCNQYVASARETLINPKLCNQDPSREARENRAIILSPMSSLVSLCSQLPQTPPDYSDVTTANTGTCNRGTDSEFVKCGFEDDDDIQGYCKKSPGKDDPCCVMAVNETAKRVIPKLVMPATNRYWVLTGLVIAGVLVISILAWTVAIMTNWKSRATQASKPLFRKSVSAAGYGPTYTEKKLALDKLSDEKFTYGVKGEDNAFFGGNRKSMLVDAMKGGGVNDLKFEGEESFEVADPNIQDGDDDEMQKPNILQNYEDQDFAIS